MKNILICLENFDCGGVETYVLSQSILLSKKYKVTIASNGGDLVDALKVYGISHEKIDFSSFNPAKFLVNKARLKTIIDKYKIDYVILHPFTTYFSCVEVFIRLSIPYSLVIHDSKAGIYWKNYSPYPRYFLENYVFKYASAIIFVSKGSKKKYLSDFKIDKTKCFVISNGVDLSVFKSSNLEITEYIKKFLIVSRLDQDKFVSIKNAIRLVVYYQNIYNLSGIELHIAGKGECEREIRNILIKQKNIKWKMLGNVVNVEKIIPKFQVVLGMGRVSVESMACGRISIISGYKSLKAIIKPSIFIKAMNRNFSGRGLRSIKMAILINELANSKEYFYEICNNNLELLKKRLSLFDLTNIFENVIVKCKSSVVVNIWSLVRLRIIVFFSVVCYGVFFDLKKIKKVVKKHLKFGAEKRQILF